MTRPSIQLQIPDVTPAHLLEKMLATCETRADIKEWEADFALHRRCLTNDEAIALAAQYAVRIYRLAGGEG